MKMYLVSQAVWHKDDEWNELIFEPLFLKRNRISAERLCKKLRREAWYMGTYMYKVVLKITEFEVE